VATERGDRRGGRGRSLKNGPQGRGSGESGSGWVGNEARAAKRTQTVGPASKGTKEEDKRRRRRGKRN